MAQALYHEEFARAGKQAGLQVWRIEKLELVPVPESAYGDFYVGDAYLVLHTTQASRGFVYRLHFWLGTGRRDLERPGRGGATPVGAEVCGREGGEGSTSRSRRLHPRRGGIGGNLAAPPLPLPPFGGTAFPLCRSPHLQMPLRAPGVAKSEQSYPTGFDLCHVCLPGFGAGSSSFSFFYLPLSKLHSRSRPLRAPPWPSSSHLLTSSVLVSLSASR